MLDRILLVTDLSADSAAAWDVAIALVQRTERAELPVLDLAVSPTAYAEVEAVPHSGCTTMTVGRRTRR